ncbi:hypothetical protein KAR91_69960 [Candidatus Pacearchaeota archaeon]|nr:hypothetical protein [Candidatus Pacearchaeota archaeon]
MRNKNNNKLVDTVLSHFESLKTERDPWANSVQTVLEEIIPGRATMQVNTDSRKYELNTNTLDSTARASAYLMANGLLGNVCSQSSKWFKLVTELPQISEIPGMNEWMDTVENVFYHLMATGSFYSGAWQIFFDAATPGLGSMFMGENLVEKTIDFLPYAPKGSYIATDSRNKIDTYFHHFTLTARDILEEYGESGNLTEDFRRTAKDKPFTRHELITAIFPRKDRDIYKKDSINKPWASVHVLRGQKTLLRESGFDSFPMSIFRYAYDSEEVYPHSPSIDGYGDIQRLRKIMTATTDVAQISAKPPTAVPAEMYNEYQIKPDFKIKAYDMARLPAPLQVGQGYPIARDREEFYRNIVKEHYFADFFIMLAAGENNQMTATEVLERQGEKATVIGGMVSRLTKEFLDPVFDRMFVIAARNNWIPAPPQEVLDSGIDISIDYLGPLSQAQNRYLKLQGPVSSLQNFLPLMEVYPQMADIIKPYNLGKRILVDGGMPSVDIRDEEEFNAIQLQKQEQQQAAAEAEQMEQRASALNKGAKAPEPGSPSEQLMGANGGQ